MANPAREDLKQYLLLALVAVCVVLVGLTWADNLDDRQVTEAGFVRGTAPVLATAVPSVTQIIPPPSATPALVAPQATITPALPPGTPTQELSGEE